MLFLRVFLTIFILFKYSFSFILHDECIYGIPQVLWKITADHMRVPSYLFGTIHLPFENVWKYLPVEIAYVFNHSSLIVLEMDPSDSVLVAQSLLKHASFSDGKMLYDVVSAEVYTNVEQYIGEHLTEKAMHNSYTAIDTLLSFYFLYKPYWVATFLKHSVTGTGDVQTLDDILGVKAQEQEKEVMGIVTPDEQFSALNWTDDGYGEYLLNDTVNMLRADNQYYNKSYDFTLAQYLCGPLFADTEDIPEDANVIAKQFHEKLAEELLSKRNRQWLPRIDHILRTSSQVFFAFGLSHMTDEDNVVELLRKEGYTVTIYTNDDNGIVLPVSIGARPDRLSFDFFANDFGTPGGVEYSGVKSRSLSAGLSYSASSMMISCLFLITVWIF